MQRLINIPRLALVAFILAYPALGQDLPDKIRGYKVHSEVVKLSNDGAVDRPSVSVATPSVADVSLSGITVSVSGELEEAGYDGRVEMLIFRDFRVNGLAVEVAEFTTPFQVTKRGRTALPVPAQVFLPARSVLKAAWNASSAPATDWTITGRILVFGRFKKFGFSFKRVVPVDVKLTVRNPLTEDRQKELSSSASK